MSFTRTSGSLPSTAPSCSITWQSYTHFAERVRPEVMKLLHPRRAFCPTICQGALR